MFISKSIPYIKTLLTCKFMYDSIFKFLTTPSRSANYYTFDFKEFFGDDTNGIDGINSIIAGYYNYDFSIPWVVDANQAIGNGIGATYNARLSIISCTDEFKKKYYDPLLLLGNFKQEHGIVISRIKAEIDCYKNGNNLVIFDPDYVTIPYFNLSSEFHNCHNR